MAGAPIVITLYDANDEVKGTYTRSFIPWEVLKEAVKLQGINLDKISEEDVDRMAHLVVAAFGDRFTIDDLNKGSDVGEMMTVINSIVSRASNAMPKNPTPQA